MNSAERLHSPPSTPADELCGCPRPEALVLFTALGPNPIHCGFCKGEVDPGRIGLNEEEADAILFWRGAADPILRLWLHSGEYEGWAKDELERIDSPLNRLGLAMIRALGPGRNAFLRYSRHGDEDEELPVARCPRCEASLEDLRGAVLVSRLVRVCRECRIAVWR